MIGAGGIRAQPTAEELRTFVEAIGELDGLQVGSLLADKMVRFCTFYACVLDIYRNRHQHQFCYMRMSPHEDLANICSKVE